MDKFGVAYGDNSSRHPNYRFSKPLVITCGSREEAITISESMNGVPFENIAERTEVDMSYVVKHEITGK